LNFPVFKHRPPFYAGENILSRNGFFRILILLAILQLSAGCGRIAYYAHCTKGQLALLSNRKSIPGLLQDPATPEALRFRLSEVQNIRDFASRTLSLPENGSYRSYADLQRPYATWNVVAAPEFSLELEQWCYPIAGCVTYRGFFDRQSAERFAEQLRSKGFDVYFYGVAAYSTLGWFDDPVLNTFLNEPPPVLAGVIFHELAHQRLYLPNDTAFSEAFATTVELLGVERWLAEQDSRQAVDHYRQTKYREEDFNLLLERLRERLAELYLQPLPPSSMRKAKQELLADFVKNYSQWKVGWNGYAGHDRWLAGGLNNAKLASVNTYHALVPAFRALFANCRSDFTLFYRQAERLSRLPAEERSRQLEVLSSQDRALPLPTEISASQ
jgi:predicted aminopeptidase